MNRVDGIDRIEQISFSRAWGGTSHIDAGDCPIGRQDHRATGRPARIGVVSNQKARNVGQASVCSQLDH